MSAVLRTWAISVAFLFAGVASAAGQIVARSTYLGDGSFELPPAGPTYPQEPSAIAVCPEGSIHIVVQRGQVMVFDPTGTHQLS